MNPYVIICGFAILVGGAVSCRDDWERGVTAVDAYWMVTGASLIMVGVAL